IADMLTRIRNACQAKHAKVEVPASNVKKEIARVLLEQKYIAKYVVIEDNKQGIIKMYLKYGSTGESVISVLNRVSKPGRRVYVKAATVPRVLNGLGIAILTTPKGILTDKQARQSFTGGEILCHIW
ncbi:MAG: 30S ribosomal protein S8, partial [Candidatus Latescibacteria bacterium]|nr:30S ribosomal protein S8 [Candidatus Latescibacterota bacterium]